MIKFISTDNEGKKMLGLIISEGNIERLKEGFPIHFKADSMKASKIECDEVMIAYFETEEKAYEFFREAGYITDKDYNS